MHIRGTVYEVMVYIVPTIANGHAIVVVPWTTSDLVLV